MAMQTTDWRFRAAVLMAMTVLPCYLNRQRGVRLARWLGRDVE